MSDHKHDRYKRADHFTREAKRSGFPARSVYKLDAIDKKARLLRRGQRVVDLGAAPGSWSLYAASRIGETGRLFAVDLQPLAQALPTNATFVLGDARELSSATLAEHGPFDVVLSDMAPNTSGNRFADQTRSAELFDFAVDVAERLGKPGSCFVGKLFMGPDFERERTRLRTLYAKVDVERPPAVRSNSIECFLVGTGKR